MFAEDFTCIDALIDERPHIDSNEPVEASGLEQDCENMKLPRHIIPSTLSLDLRDPGVGTKRLDAAGLGGEAPPSLAGGIDDSLVIVMQPVREEALLEVEPHPLDRIELRRIGRQGHERAVGRHREWGEVLPAA